MLKVRGRYYNMKHNIFLMFHITVTYWKMKTVNPVMSMKS